MTSQTGITFDYLLKGFVYLLKGIYLTSLRASQWARFPRIVTTRGASCLDCQFLGFYLF